MPHGGLHDSDAFEERCNEEICTRWQHNRNPFVDHPDWAGAIWG